MVLSDLAPILVIGECTGAYIVAIFSASILAFPCGLRPKLAGLAVGCGTAEQITERIMEIQDKYPGLEYMHVGCNRMGVPLDVMIEQLERFGKEVMPKFNVAKPA